MIKVSTSNVENLTKKIMTNAENVSMKYLENGKLKGACEYKFTNLSSPESRASAAKKLDQTLERLPENCGELFTTIV